MPVGPIVPAIGTQIRTRVPQQGITLVPAPTSPSEDNPTRYRSFVERYVIARATFFRVGHEKEDAWVATKDAEQIYKKIGQSSRKYKDKDDGTGI